MGGIQAENQKLGHRPREYPYHPNHNYYGSEDISFLMELLWSGVARGTNGT